MHFLIKIESNYTYSSPYTFGGRRLYKPTFMNDFRVGQSHGVFVEQWNKLYRAIALDARRVDTVDLDEPTSNRCKRSNNEKNKNRFMTFSELEFHTQVHVLRWWFSWLYDEWLTNSALPAFKYLGCLFRGLAENYRSSFRLTFNNLFEVENHCSVTNFY